MAFSEFPLLRRLWRRTPLPVFALILGLAFGGGAWVVIDRTQTRALNRIFDQALAQQLQQSARGSLARFDEYKGSFEFLARLLANHRRMGRYLNSPMWVSGANPEPVSYAGRPPWLPRGHIWRGLVKPDYLLLTDSKGGLRQVYSLAGEALPGQAEQNPGLFPAVFPSGGAEHSYFIMLDNKPYLLVSEPLQVHAVVVGSMVMLVAVNSAFLAASQQGVKSDKSIAALVSTSGQRILSSSDPLRIQVGSSMRSLHTDYLVTTQSFAGYDGSDLNTLFATLVPRATFVATSQAVLDLERRQRAIGAASIIAAFVLVFLLVSARIDRLLKRLQDFARKALGEKMAPRLPATGNRLLMLEDRVRDVIDLVLSAREEMRSRHASEVQQIEDLRAALMDASVDGIATVDARGKVIDFNPTAEAMFRRTLEQVKGRQLCDLVFDAESASYFRDLLQEYQFEMTNGEAPLRHELTAISSDERPFTVEVSLKPVQLGKDLVFTVYLRDVTERKAREAEIRALAAFPEESPSPMLRINARGVITYANAPSSALLNYWKCRPMQTLPVYWRRQVEAVLRTGEVLETEITTDDGQYSLLITPIQGLGYVNIYARDVTMQRRMEDALQQRQNELLHVARLSTMGEMSTGIAHELNQPLSAIVNFSNGCARRLRLDIGGKEELLSAMAQIAAQANRAAEIIKRLRSLVTKQKTVRDEVDLNYLIVEVCDLLAYDLRRQAIILERRLDPVPLWIRVDTVQIEQALLNLLRNAMDSMRDCPAQERRIEITSGQMENDMVFVSVRDQGVGIAEKDRQHLFDAFYTTKDTGMGMGLAITQTIVENHHGRIYARSQPGKGSVFTIELPRNLETQEGSAS